MRRFVLCLLIGCVLLGTSCTGQFRLTKKVHTWQTHFEGKWTDELAFLGCVILPVYGLSMLGDAIIFNSIQFWGGDNPIGEARLEKDGKTVEMALQRDGSICLFDGQQTLILERTDAGVIAKDADGNVMYTAIKGENKQISVYDASGTRIGRSSI